MPASPARWRCCSTAPYTATAPPSDRPNSTTWKGQAKQAEHGCGNNVPGGRCGAQACSAGAMAGKDRQVTPTFVGSMSVRRSTCSSAASTSSCRPCRQAVQRQKQGLEAGRFTVGGLSEQLQSWLDRAPVTMRSRRARPDCPPAHPPSTRLAALLGSPPARWACPGCACSRSTTAPTTCCISNTSPASQPNTHPLAGRALTAAQLAT